MVPGCGGLSKLTSWPAHGHDIGQLFLGLDFGQNAVAWKGGGRDMFFLSSHLRAQRLWWVPAGRSPPPIHAKLSPCTGRERGGLRGAEPSAAEVRPSSMGIVFNDQKEELVDVISPRRKLFCVRGGRASPAHHAQNSLHARGENVGALPRCGPVRGQGVAESCSPARGVCPKSSLGKIPQRYTHRSISGRRQRCDKTRTSCLKN